jgi:tetratricopeptide (TPR) repeat protein
MKEQQSIGNAAGPEAALKHLRDHVDKGDWKTAVTEIDALQQSTPKTLETRAIMASCHLLRARALMHLGDFTKAWAESDRAQALAKEALRPAIEAEAMCVVANIHWKKGKLLEALALLEKASVVAKASNDDRVQGIVNLEMASVHMKKLEYNDAEREYREAILALERAGDHRQLARAYNNFAHVFLYQGLWPRAEEMFLKCRKLSEKAGFRSAGAWASFNRADALLELDKVKEAKEELDRALPILEELGDIYGQVVTKSIYAVVYAMEGDYVKAEGSLEAAVELNKKIDIPHLKGRLSRDRAMVFKFRGDKTKAIKLLKEAREVYQSVGSTSEVTRADRKLKEIS